MQSKINDHYINRLSQHQVDVRQHKKFRVPSHQFNTENLRRVQPQPNSKELFDLDA